MILYLIGVFIALIVNISVFTGYGKEYKQITLSDSFCILLMSILSWAEILMLFMFISVKFLVKLLFGNIENNIKYDKHI